MEGIIAILIVVICILFYNNKEKEKHIKELSNKEIQIKKDYEELTVTIEKEQLKYNDSINNLKRNLDYKEREINKLKNSIEFQREEKRRVIIELNKEINNFKNKCLCQERLNKSNIIDGNNVAFNYEEKNKYKSSKTSSISCENLEKRKIENVKQDKLEFEEVEVDFDYIECNDLSRSEMYRYYWDDDYGMTDEDSLREYLKKNYNQY